MPAGYNVVILNLYGTYSREGWNECVQRSRRRASEKKFKAIVDNPSDAIVLCDDHGCCADINEATRRIPGYEINDLRVVRIENRSRYPKKWTSMRYGRTSSMVKFSTV
ncbi:MAG: PAS domain S-box protein [Dyadobacter sp.]|uniref:PAS domain S-box protein n=1 Tax=Dyadobacter sp. TaxID=1914288 RepID=UPI001B0B9FD9|nr:PAS domain S-box protein [Dyadobacter sp.]